MLLGEAKVHAKDLGDKKCSFVAACAGAELENDVLLVIGVLGEEEYLELLFDGGETRLKHGEFLLGHGLHVGVQDRRAWLWLRRCLP